MSEHSFQVLPMVDVPRTKFRKPFKHLTSFNLGEIVPIYWDEVLPGQTKKIDVNHLIRMSTPIAPILDDIEVEYFAFFVPNRLIACSFANGSDYVEFEFSNTVWKNVMGENIVSYGIDGIASDNIYDSLQAFDLINPVDGSWFINDPLSIGAYLGLPVLPNNIQFAYNSCEINVLPFLAYVSIYNRWFRDQNVEAPIMPWPLDSSRFCLNSKLLTAYKKSDYFTRALPYAQKGNPVTLPLGTTAPLVTGTAYDIDDPFFGNKLDVSAGVHPLYTAVYSASQKGMVYPSASSTPTSPVMVNQTNLYVDLRNATAATINQLRYAAQLQKLLERDSLYGTRYWEILKGHFGITSPDASLQDPEFLGYHKDYINIDQVVQTTGATGSSSQTLGVPGANSVSGTHGSICTKSFTEHGIFMVCMVARQTKHTYGQGVSRAWTRLDRYDFYWPEFANLGAQSILEKEIYIDKTETIGFNEVFGYQEAWAEYRFMPNRTSGLLNPAVSSSYNFWSLAEAFGSAPTLSISFLKVDRTNLARCLTTGQNGPDFIGDFYFDSTDVLPMPAYSIPGLMDHH